MSSVARWPWRGLAIGVVAVLTACSAPASVPPVTTAAPPLTTAAPAAMTTATDGPPVGAKVLWVDPAAGRDAAAGTKSAPLRTVAEAWRRIPNPRTVPTWVQLRAGTYPEGSTPNYWEHKRGTAAAPLVFNAVDGRGTAVFRGDINAFDVQHWTIQGVAVVRDGDVFHCERCSSVTLDRVRFDGRGAAHETVKVNQSDHLVIIRSDIGGAYENAIDFVAVQHALIMGNTIHHSDDWCAYVKGGSADILVTRNLIHHCGTGGFTAGQGTGLEFMVAPWLRYETYGVTVTHNIIRDTDGAGLGVNGGYNTVLAHNTLVRVGARSHAVEFVQGSRSCDGDTTRCAALRRAGAWGGVGVDGQYIPNRHTSFVNNVVWNPAGYRTQWQHFTVADPVTPPPGSGVPSPARADDDLVIRGNVIWNGGVDMATGLSGDRERLLVAANRINTLRPTWRDAAKQDFHPTGALASLASVPLPTMRWTDGGPGIPALTAPTLPADHPPGALRP